MRTGRARRRTFAEEVAGIVVDQLRDMLASHDTAIPSVAQPKEEKCQDDGTKNPVSLGRRGSRARSIGGSARLTRKQMEDEADALIDILSTSRRRKSGAT